MLRETSLGAYLDLLASASPTPGGGAAAALTLAQAAALLSMVCNLTLGKQKFADAAAPVSVVLADAKAVLVAAERLADLDATVFEAYMAALGLPKDPGQAHESRAKALQGALVDAARVPLAVYELAGHLLAPNGAVQVLLAYGNPAVASDVHVARFLAGAALQASAANVQVNLDLIKDPAIAAPLRSRLVHSSDVSFWIHEASQPRPAVTGGPQPDQGAVAAVEAILGSLPRRLLAAK